MMMSLGDRVKMALEGPPKRTQVALARACGVHPVSVNDWVHDRTQSIEGGHLLSAAAFLGVSAKWLAEGLGPMRPTEVSPRLETSPHAWDQSTASGNDSRTRALVEGLAALARPQRPTLRKNLANLLTEVVEHPDDDAMVEQTIADIERFFKASQSEG